jgi:long-chain acyl-CoA synthetase
MWSRSLTRCPCLIALEQVGGCFCPLSSGAAIRYPATRQPSALAELMREWRPTVLAGVPQLLSGVMGGIEREAAARGRTEMLESMRRAADRLPRVARRLLFRPVTSRLGAALEFVITGGAAVDPLLQHKWEQMGIDVLEGYGATECAPVITSNPLGHGRPGSVGRVLPRQELRIAEDGEVLTRGRNVFAGYWQNDAATSAVVQDGWYHTGDLGVLDADGFLWLKGRKKDLIVLSDGQNVYPDDVETVLKRQVGVADAVVLGLQRDGLIRVHAAIIESVPGAAAEAVRSANAVLDARQQVMGFTVWPDADFPRTHTLKIRRPLVLEYLQHQVLAPSAPAASDHGVDPLLHTIAGLYRGDNDISEDSTLGDDLGFDSLARVELLSAIEDDLGVYIDDTEVGAETTVSELRRLVAQREPRPKVRRFPEWSRSFPVRWIREAAQRVLVFPALCRFYHVEVVGAEHALLDRPVLVVSNHILHLDAAIIVASVPPRLRRHLAIAAAADDIFGVPWRGYGAALLGNAFPFSNDGSGVRDSLEYLARTLDDGWSVLIFPEGMLTLYGPMQPFKSGVGLVAVEARVPVLPLRIDVMRPGFGDRLRLPFQRGHVRVTFGEPLRFGPDTPYATAVDRLEDAVRGA